MTEACHGVTDIDERTDSLPAHGLLPCCIYCTRRQDARTSQEVHWIAPVVVLRAGRWHCAERLPAAVREPEPA